LAIKKKIKLGLSEEEVHSGKGILAEIVKGRERSRNKEGRRKKKTGRGNRRGEGSLPTR